MNAAILADGTLKWSAGKWVSDDGRHLAGVYAIEHIVTGSAYIGEAFDLWSRWRFNAARLQCGKHHNKRLQRAWDEHGPAAFRFVLLEAVPRSVALEEMLTAEKRWLAYYLDHQDGQRLVYNIAIARDVERYRKAQRRPAGRPRKERPDA